MTLGPPAPPANRHAAGVPSEPRQPWYRFGARRPVPLTSRAAWPGISKDDWEDPQAVPLVDVPHESVSTLRVIRPANTSTFPVAELVYETGPRGPRVGKLRVAPPHQRQGLAGRLVERFVAQHGGPGEYLSTDVTDDGARAFWRAMEDRYGIVLVRPNGGRIVWGAESD